MKEEFKKYLAMILAVFCTAALSILFFFILFRMDALQSLIGKILNILMPFIYGAGIAYVLKPLCNTYERFLNKHWHPKRQKLIVTECDRKYCDRSGGHLCSPGYAASAVGTECGEDCTVTAGDDREYQSYGGSSV